jgi:hypothetical protein
MRRLLRKDTGAPLRAAMRERSLTGPALAAATKRIDPTGRGISPALVGRLTGQGKTAREHCRPRTGQLIADALGCPLEELFVTPSSSTSTVERSTPDGD